MSTDGGSDGTRDPRPADTITNIVDQVTSACAASQCPDAAVMTNLYNETMLNNFDTYLQSGQLQTKIRIWAAERVPPVPDLFEVQILGTTFNTDGTFVNMLDDPNATVEALSITTSGKLSVTCLNTTHSPLPKKIRRRPALKVLSSLHSSKLGLALTLPPMQLQQMPPLPTLLKMHFGGTSTLDNRFSCCCGNKSRSIIYRHYWIDSYTKTHVSDCFESAISATLLAEGTLPEGAYVTARISDTGVVSYIITMHMSPSADNTIIVEKSMQSFPLA